MYYAVATITTVGYGDIAPYTKKERSFGIMYMIVAGGLFSVIIGSMNSFIENLYAEDEEFEKQMSQMTKFMEKKNTPLDVQQNVKKYLNYNHNTTQDKDYDKLYKLITNDLENEIKIEIYKKIIMSCGFFNSNFSDKFITELCKIFEEKTCAPTEIIFKKGQHKTSLFFVVNRDCIIRSYKLLLL